VELLPLGGDGTTGPRQDTVSFAGRQVTSAWLGEAGYPSTDYTLTVDGAGAAIWETMQRKTPEGVAFWRGTFLGDAMRGAVSQQPAAGAALDFTFAGHEVSGKMIGEPPHAGAAAAERALLEQVQVTPAVADAPAEPAETPAAPKKKRRRWLFGF
jgi:hypothetical protein